MNYKSGDLVKITGNSNGNQFKIGETVRLKYRVESFWAAEYLDGRDWWNVRESDMTPAKPTTMPQKIVITTDGKTTLAWLFDGKTMVKRAEAKCAPSDVFDFGVGAELAVKRLMGEDKPVAVNPITEPVESEPVKLFCVQSWMPGSWITKGKIYEIGSNGHIRFDDGYSPTWESLAKPSMQTKSLFPLVRRPAKVGEWVLITKACGCSTELYRNGEVHKVTGQRVKGESVELDCGGKAAAFATEYLVLDGYTGDSE